MQLEIRLKNKIITFFLLVIVILITSLNILFEVYAESIISAKPNSAAQIDLELILKSDKQLYQQGEQIKLVLQFKNSSKNQDLKILKSDLEKDNLLKKLDFRRDGYPLVSYKLREPVGKGTKLSATDVNDFILLGPQQEYQVEMVVNTVLPADSDLKYFYESSGSNSERCAEGQKCMDSGSGYQKLFPAKYQIGMQYVDIVNLKYQDVIIVSQTSLTSVVNSNIVTVEILE